MQRRFIKRPPGLRNGTLFLKNGDVGLAARAVVAGRASSEGARSACRTTPPCQRALATVECPGLGPSCDPVRSGSPAAPGLGQAVARPAQALLARRITPMLPLTSLGEAHSHAVPPRTVHTKRLSPRGDIVVVRLGVVVDDRPDSLPINHLVDHGTVVFRTGTGTKLLAAPRRAGCLRGRRLGPGRG